jgi:hypothetical protein
VGKDYWSQRRRSRATCTSQLRRESVELLDKIKLKYPEIYSVLISELYRAIKSGKIASMSGALVYNIITMLNLDVKPDLKIKFVKRGREVSLRDYIE